MGSGKRNYKKRPKKFSLGGYNPKDHKIEISKENKEKFISFWEEMKRKRKEQNK